MAVCMSESWRKVYMWGGWRVLLLVLIPAVLTGCTSLKPAGMDLEKQIERQQQMELLNAEPEKQETLTLAEYEAIGDRYILNKDINRAYFNYMKALAIEPENVPLLHKQGKLLAKKEKYAEGEKVFRKLLAISEDDALAYEGLGRSLLGQKKTAEAEKAFLAAIERNKDLWQSHHFLGLVYSAQQEYEKAVVEFKLALSFRPQDSAVLNNLAITYYLQGEYEQAEVILRTLTKSTQQKKVYNNLAITYVQLGRYNEALSAFKKGSKSEASAYNNIGIEFLAHERYEEAIGAFEKAIALNPQFYPSANANLDQARKALQQRMID
jgi:tetratricopeptide (TPR) repeat protein